MMKKTHIQLFLTFLLMVWVLGACDAPTPIVVFVTPTSETDSVPTVALTSVDATTTATNTAVPARQATAVPTEGPPTERPGPTVTFMGPIVGPDYQPPATNTPRPSPTATPTQPPTAGPSPSPTVAPPTTTSAAPTGTALPSLDTSNLGIQTISNLEQSQWSEVLRRVDDDLQLGWVKVQVNWSFFQPNGPGEINDQFRRLEIFVEQAGVIEDMNVLISVAKAPAWARSTNEEDGPPDDPQALADFVELLLTEIDGIAAVEVWNEPNLAREWRGQPLNGQSYMRYFVPTYQRIRAISPDVGIVTGGLAPTSNSSFSADDRQYLRQMYAAGLAQYTDIAVGVHPYGWGNPPDARCCDLSDERGWDDDPHFFFLDTIEAYRNIMVNSGHSSVPMWFTEFGWASWDRLPGDPPELWYNYSDQFDQGNYTLRAIEIGNSLDYVDVMILWNLNFAQPILIEQRDERIAYSLVLPEGAPQERVLYWMLYDAVRPDEQLERYD